MRTMRRVSHLRRPYRGLLIIMTALIVFVTANCGSVPQQQNSRLSAALELVPADGQQIFFTDWSLIKEYEDVTDLTSESDLQHRIDFMRSLTEDQAAFILYEGIQYIQEHANVWSWDSTDIDWEITFTGQDDMVGHVIKLREDFDMAPVVAHFVERGFEEIDYHGIPIYSHELDFTADWFQVRVFDILNTSVLSDQNLLVLSASQDVVQQTLDVHLDSTPSAAEQPGFQQLAQQLEPVATAFLEEDVCSSFPMMSPIPSKVQDESNEEEFAMELQQPQGLAIGYRYEDMQPIGIAVLHYDDASQAEADLEGRRLIATEGISLVAREPYRDILFTVEDTTVEDQNIVFSLRPFNDQPMRLVNMVLQRDVGFAACSQ